METKIKKNNNNQRTMLSIYILDTILIESESTTRFKNWSSDRMMTSDWLVDVSDDRCTTSNETSYSHDSALSKRFVVKITVERCDEFLVAVPQIFDSVKSVALWSAKIFKKKDHQGLRFLSYLVWWALFVWLKHKKEDNCIVYENFAALIGGLMVTNICLLAPLRCSE
jgi:hypothetical protein